MQVIIKDITFVIEPETGLAKVTIGGRASAVTGLFDADDLEKVARLFSNQAKLLQGN